MACGPNQPEERGAQKSTPPSLSKFEQSVAQYPGFARVEFIFWFGLFRESGREGRKVRYIACKWLDESAKRSLSLSLVFSFLSFKSAKRENKREKFSLPLVASPFLRFDLMALAFWFELLWKEIQSNPNFHFPSLSVPFFIIFLSRIFPVRIVILIPYSVACVWILIYWAEVVGGKHICEKKSFFFKKFFYINLNGF